MSQIAARAGVHRADKLEARRILGLARGARNRDSAGLERLAQGFEHLAVEFRQLVQKQHAVVRERYSPGRGSLPPPTSATPEAEWCGARNGRRFQFSRQNPPEPSEASAADSSASSPLIGGSNPAKRAASIDLPVPGGPTISTLWPPAAATSSARFVCACPFTSARSG